MDLLASGRVSAGHRVCTLVEVSGPIILFVCIGVCANSLVLQIPRVLRCHSTFRTLLFEVVAILIGTPSPRSPVSVFAFVKMTIIEDA